MSKCESVAKLKHDTNIDRRFWTPYLPRRITKMKFNIAQCEAAFNKETALAGMDGYITEVTPTTANDAATYVGDIDVFDPATGEVEIQIEGLQMQSFTTARPSQDRELYLQTIWDKDISSGIISDSEILDDDHEKLYLVDLGERLSYAYMRHLRSEISPDKVPENHRPLFNWIDHVMEQVSSATHPSIKPEWNCDDLEELKALASKYPDCVDLELMKAVGNNLPDVVRGTTTMLEHMLPNGLLDRLYTEGIGMATSNKYVTQAMKKIGHRYPQMRVLEIGAGTGGATKGIFKGIGDAFAHYTFTDISTGFFMKARDVFADYADRMTFSLLNCEKDPLEQGYEAHSFDVIVASNVLHATEFLEKTMTNVRKLLKPGGYLCLLECTGHLERTGFLMAGLPGWWLGGADGRPYRPTISPPEWDDMLRKTGFSGVDSIVNDFKDTSRYTVSVILSQALDDDVQKLREPLKSKSIAGKELVVIGGATPATMSLIENLSKSIPGWEARKTTVFSSWDEAAEHIFPFGTTVLSVADMDEPIFKAMNAQRLKGMQAVINSAESILWVTSGCRADQPHANMAVGLGRSLVSEMPHLRLQFLDVSSTDKVDTIIGETLVRLEVLTSLETRKDDLLWSIELEMIYEQGSFLLPRVRPIQSLNNKLNATRRVITQEVDPSSNKVAVVPSSGGDRFNVVISEEPQIAPESEVNVTVSFSSLFAVKVEGRFIYLVLGHTTSDPNSPVLALSTSNQSLVTVSREWVVQAKENSAEYLQFAVAALLAEAILSEALPGVFVYEPSFALAKALSSQAVSAGKSVVFGGSTQGPASSTHRWIRIHPSLSKRAIREIIPTSVNSFIDFSGTGGEIKDAIPNSSHLDVDNFLLVGSKNPSELHNPSAILNQAKSYAESMGNEKIEPSLISPAASLRNGKISSFSPFSVVDWKKDTTLAVDVKPFTQKHIFDGNKSYLLAGLTGDLGQSICRWMIGAGARNLIIGSR
jgi:ubiquinone/menaquinone biosynthesis C-methylase UbiE